jgi:hypothetical protein
MCRSVMAGLGPGRGPAIHVFGSRWRDVDGRPAPAKTSDATTMLFDWCSHA